MTSTDNNNRHSTLAERCNNPLNIRFSPANKWMGQSGELRGFCIFENEAYGFRAAFKIVQSYLRQGHDTIEKIVTRWAPPTENQTERYMSFVENDVMIDRHRTLHMKSIHGYWEIIMILRAMAKMECGKWYDEQQINLFINYPQNF